MRSNGTPYTPSAPFTSPDWRRFPDGFCLPFGARRPQSSSSLHHRPVGDLLPSTGSGHHGGRTRGHQPGAHSPPPCAWPRAPARDGLGCPGEVGERAAPWKPGVPHVVARWPAGRRVQGAIRRRSGRRGEGVISGALVVARVESADLPDQAASRSSAGSAVRVISRRSCAAAVTSEPTWCCRWRRCSRKVRSSTGRVVATGFPAAMTASRRCPMFASWMRSPPKWVLLNLPDDGAAVSNWTAGQLTVGSRRSDAPSPRQMRSRRRQATLSLGGCCAGCRAAPGRQTASGGYRQDGHLARLSRTAREIGVVRENCMCRSVRSKAQSPRRCTSPE